MKLQQHPGEIGMFYCWHFTDAKWALESNEVFGLREPRTPASAESTDFSEKSDCDVSTKVGVNKHLLAVWFWQSYLASLVSPSVEKDC